MSKRHSIKIIFFLLLFQILFCSISAQKLHVFKTEFLPKRDSVYVFAPQNHNKSDCTYPVIYMLHGYGGNYKTWSNISPLQEYSNKYGFIIVCPDGLYDTWYINSPVNKRIKFENFFINELYPFINENYKADKENIFITGLSMGGYGALHLYKNNINKFKAVGSTSALLDLAPFSESFGLPLVLGKYKTSKQNYIDYSIFNYLEKLKKSKYHIFIDCGLEDPFYRQNLEFFDKCKKAEINISFTYRPGDHNRGYWRESIKDHFVYFYYLSKLKNNEQLF